MIPHEHQLVALKKPYLDILPEGAVGTIVHIYKGALVCEVEFPNHGHRVVTLEADQLQPAEGT